MVNEECTAIHITNPLSDPSPRLGLDWGRSGFFPSARSAPRGCFARKIKNLCKSHLKAFQLFEVVKHDPSQVKMLSSSSKLAVRATARSPAFCVARRTVSAWSNVPQG